MEKFKENVKFRNHQNIVSTVLLVCFLMLSLAFWGALFSSNNLPEKSDAFKLSQNSEILGK